MDQKESENTWANLVKNVISPFQHMVCMKMVQAITTKQKQKNLHFICFLVMFLVYLRRASIVTNSTIMLKVTRVFDICILLFIFILSVQHTLSHHAAVTAFHCTNSFSTIHYTQFIFCYSNLFYFAL
jgi:hypothetical protein